LKVKKEGDYLTLDFPADDVKKVSPPERLLKALKLSQLNATKVKLTLCLYLHQDKRLKMYRSIALLLMI
jgi:hypothetical protein